MTFNRIIQKIHTYTGLQAVLALLLFFITIIAVSIKSDKEPEITYYQFEGELSLTDIKLARALHEQIGLRFEAVPQHWMLSGQTDKCLVLKLNSPAAKREITINKINGHIEIKSWPLSFSDFANYMHQESIGRRKVTDSLWLWAWSLYIEISILALFLLPATGLYLWISNKTSKQTWAKYSLASSLIIMATLWNLIR